MGTNRKLRMGMIGGSREAFIGSVHRMAIALDGEIELVAGAFSSDPLKSEDTGRLLYMDPARVYSSFSQMLSAERLLPENQKIDFVTVVTPNHMHFQPCKEALENGFHVMCEKPLAFSTDEGLKLEKIVRETGLLFALTHNYTAYPMVKEAREIIHSGRLGKVLKIVAEYQQGWLSDRIESEGQKQALWRTDPGKAGISCCVADIGTHAENLAFYVTGLEINEVLADITTFVEGRKLEDDANILVRYKNGAKGVMIISQVAAGEENELKLRVYCEKGNLVWLQSDPNKLILKSGKGPIEILRPGNDYLSDKTKKGTRLPSGHPEGYIESLANLYKNFAQAIKTFNYGQTAKEIDFPSVKDGVKGLQFTEAVIRSAKNNTWERI